MSDDSVVENRPSPVDNKRVQFEINRRLDPKDLDILSLYLENKKQSGGGDILKLEEDVETGKVLTVIYEEADVQARVLAKKFFKFQNYILRSTENGYRRNCIYPLDKTRIILKNIPLNEEELVIQMYAEYLLPDNTVNEVTQMQFIPNTFVISYENDVDYDLLETRNKRKPALRNSQIEVLRAYKTDTLIIGSKQNSTIEEIWTLLNENFPQTLKTDTTPFMFIEETNEKKFLCQFDDANIELLARIVLKENGFELAYCFNFDLITSCINDKLSTENDVKFKKCNNKVSVCNKAVQTESNIFDKSPVENVPYQIVQDKENLKASINSLAHKFNQIKSNATLVQTKTPINGHAESVNVLTLDPRNNYTIGLLNSKQAFINFEEYLSNINKSLSLTIVELTDKKKQLLVVRKPTANNKDDKVWKDMFLNELNKYFHTRAMFRTLKIPVEILKSQHSMTMLRSTFIELNRTCSAVFFRIENDEIQGYGVRKSVLKQFESLPRLLKTLEAPTTKSDNKLFGSDLAIKIESSSLLYTVLLNCNTVVKDFKKNIRDLGGDLVSSTVKDGEELKIECITDNADPIPWTKSIHCLVENYETSRLKRKRLSIPPGLRRDKEMDDLRKHLEFHFKLPLSSLCYKVNQDSITIQGYTANIKNFVDNIHSKFNNLENNIKDRIKRKLDVKIDAYKYPTITILSNSNGFYLKEFSNQLLNLEASVELNNTDATKLKITCQMKKAKLQNEQAVQTWRKNIDAFLSKYFNKFKVKHISLGKADPDLLKAFNVMMKNDKMKKVWKDETNVEIIGLSTEMSNLVTDSASMPTDQKKLDGKEVKLNDSDKLPSKIDISSSEETFQISDLKWFQTRMLFEKKYFQFVSETYKKLAIMIDTNLTWILYTGQKQDIEDAQKLAFDILDKILGTEVDADQARLNKMIEVEAYLENSIKQNGLCCIVDAKSDDTKFTIYGTTPDEIGKCKLILSEIDFA